MTHVDDHKVPAARPAMIPSLEGFRKRDKEGQEDAVRNILQVLQRDDVSEFIRQKRQKLLGEYQRAAGWTDEFINQLAVEVRSATK